VRAPYLQSTHAPGAVEPLRGPTCIRSIMIRRAADFLALFAMGALDSHAQMARPFPSLAQRPVEAVDRFDEPAAPAAVQPAAPDPTLAQTVERLRASAAEADSAFQA